MKKLFTIICSSFVLLCNAQVRHPFYKSDDNINGLQHLISDFGARRYKDTKNNTYSLFHKGIDYTYVGFSNSADKKAYAIQCCPNLEYKDDGDYASYVTIGDNWLYMHILRGSYKSLNWALYSEDITDIKDNKKIGFTTLLETIGDDGNAKIFVVNNNADAVGIKRKTIWGVEKTTVQKVEKGDVIFRPNYANHLHIQNGVGDRAYLHSPLEYISYEGEGFNFIKSTLSLKYKDSNGNASKLLKSDKEEIVFGKEVILEADVNSIDQYDLNKVFIYCERSDGSNNKELAKWIYNGTGHGKWTSSTGKGMNEWDQIYMKPDNNDKNSDNDISEISISGDQGIYPVNTKTIIEGVDQNLGREIYKKYWNTLEKWNTGNPAFPDGRYKLELITWDIMDNERSDLPEQKIENQLIDNFKPYIKKVYVTVGEDVNNGKLAYSREWTWSGGNLNLSPLVGDGCDPDKTVWVHVIPSEPMTTVNLTVNDKNPSETNRQDIKKDDSNTVEEWLFKFDKKKEILGESNQITISQKSTDLAGNALFGFAKDQDLYNATTLPKRNSDGSWSDGSKSNDGCDDNSHVFGGTLIGVYECSRAVTGLNARSEGGSVNIMWGCPEGVSDCEYGEYEYRVYKSKYDLSSLNDGTKPEDISGWIKNSSYKDSDPTGGDLGLIRLYYYVEARHVTTEKSAKIKNSINEGCDLAEVSVEIDGNNQNVDCFETHYYDQNCNDNLCSYEFELIYNCENYDDIDYVKFYFGDGSELEGIGGNGYWTSSHDYTQDYKKQPFNPFAIAYYYDRSVSDPIYFYPSITIPEMDYELEPVINNLYPVEGTPVTITATCHNARADIGDIYWQWCIENINKPGECIKNELQQNDETSCSIEHTFTAEGNYRIILTVSDPYKSPVTVEKIVSVSENCITAYVSPYFEDVLEIQDDCPNEKVVYHMPKDLIVGKCNGVNYYLWEIKLYDGVGQNNQYWDYSQYYITARHSPPVFDPIWYFRVRDIDALDYWMGKYSSNEQPYLSFEIIGRGYNEQKGQFEGDVLSNIVTKKITWYSCNSKLTCDNGNKLNTLILKNANEPLNSQWGYIEMLGDGGKVLNRSAVNIIARKSILLKSGVKISNSRIKASIIPCDYSNCDIFDEYQEQVKSAEFLSDLVEANELVIKNIKIYPNPVCDYLNIETIEPVNDEIQRIKICDMAGRMVKRIGALKNYSLIDVTDLILGSYILTITCDDKDYNYKFIKE